MIHRVGPAPTGCARRSVASVRGVEVSFPRESSPWEGLSSHEQRSSRVGSTAPKSEFTGKASVRGKALSRPSGEPQAGGLLSRPILSVHFEA